MWKLFCWQVESVNLHFHRVFRISTLSSYPHAVVTLSTTFFCAFSLGAVEIWFFSLFFSSNTAATQRCGKKESRWQLMDVPWSTWWISLELEQLPIPLTKTFAMIILGRCSWIILVLAFNITTMPKLLLNITITSLKMMERKSLISSDSVSRRRQMEWFGKLFIQILFNDFFMYVLMLLLPLQQNLSCQQPLKDSHESFQWFSYAHHSTHSLHCFNGTKFSHVRQTWWTSNAFRWLELCCSKCRSFCWIWWK